MVKAAFNFIRSHFEAYRKRGRSAFLWRITIESLVVPLAVIALLSVLFHLSPRSDLARMGAWSLLVNAVILAPFFETLLFQTLPVMLARTMGAGFWWQVFASIVPFALAHFTLSVGSGVGAGIVSGFYLAFTYVHWRQTSFRTALWMTSGLHALHNLVAVGVVLVSRHF